MASETIVAVFDTAAHAQAAISSLIAQGVPAGAIEQYAQDNDATVGTTSTTTTERKTGLWAWLTGEEGSTTATDHHALYDQSIHSGGTVVTVVTDAADADKVYGIISAHDPVDLEERHAHYNATGAYGNAGAGMVATAVPDTAAVKGTDETLTLSEETLQVGKRAVEGTTRIRRYVVERPVEEQVRLRNETVSVYRRPVTGATVGTDAFTDRTITMSETKEEAVVAKSAHVVEEVVLHKDVSENVETVRDTLRREEVEIEGPETTTATGVTKPRI